MGRILDWLVSEGLGIEKVAAPKKAGRQAQGTPDDAKWAAEGLRPPTARERAITLPKPGAIPHDPATARGQNTDLAYFDRSENPRNLGRQMRSPAIVDRGTMYRSTTPTTLDTSDGNAQLESQYMSRYGNTPQQKSKYQHQPIPKSPEAKYYRPDEMKSGKYESKEWLDDARSAQESSAKAAGYPAVQGKNWWQEMKGAASAIAAKNEGATGTSGAVAKGGTTAVPPAKSQQTENGGWGGGVPGIGKERQEGAKPLTSGQRTAAIKGQESAGTFTVRRGQGYASLAKQLKMPMGTAAERQASLGDLRKMVGAQNKDNTMLHPGMQFNAPTLGAAAYAGKVKLPGARPAPKPVAAAPQPAPTSAPQSTMRHEMNHQQANRAPVAAPVVAPQTFTEQNLAANRPGGPLNTTGVISPVRKGLSAGQQMNVPRPQVAPTLAPTSQPSATQLIPKAPMMPAAQPAAPMTSRPLTQAQPAAPMTSRPPSLAAPAAATGAPKAPAVRSTSTSVTSPIKVQTAPAVPKPKTGLAGGPP